MLKSKLNDVILNSPKVWTYPISSPKRLHHDPVQGLVIYFAVLPVLSYSADQKSENDNI